MHPEDAYGIEKCWDEEIDLMCRDIGQTVDFLKNRCTGEEFVWLSEVFEEVQEQTQSTILRGCLLALTRKYPDETKEFNIMEFIDGLNELDV